MTEPEHAWEEAEREMREAGIKLDNIPDAERGPGDQRPFMWLDALCLLWYRNKRLPTAWELARDMFDEWDDPCSASEAQEVLDSIT
jgi:hypothetical protein